MPKSLEQKLIEKVKQIILDLKSQDIVPTDSKILTEIKQLKEFQRMPENVLKRNIDNITNIIDPDKKLKKNKLNSQLPYIKKAQENNNQQQDDEINQEIQDTVNKKVKTNNSENDNASEIENIVGLEQLGGIDQALKSIQEHIYLPLKNQQIFQQLNVQPPKGLLITGPVGSGKTALGLGICKDIFTQYGVPFFFKASTEIIGGISGESEKNIRKIFKDATQHAPSIIFIDEIDAIAGSRDKASKEMEKRVVSELLSSLDKLPSNVFVLAATSRPETLESAIRRGGRFDNEIVLSVPDDDQRYDILKKLTMTNPLSKDVDLNDFAKRTPGYVPADLSALIRKAGVIAVQRIVDQNEQISQNDKMECEGNNQNSQNPEQQEEKEQEQKENQNNFKQCYIEKQDFETALTQVQPTGKREGFTSIPEVSWDDIGGLQTLKDDLYNNIILPITSPEKFTKFAINSPAGVLLYGPPGCGKTLLAKAVANASRANFIAVKGPELLNKYVGESERSVRALFSRAKASSPCIIFFDELDALCPKRGSDGNQVTERVVNSLLAELDGVEARKQVYIIAATNRPDIIDPAMLRGGRLDKLFYVPLPDADDRIQILQAQLRKMPLEKDIDLKELALSKKCINYSGADLGSVVKEAGLLSILADKETVSQKELMQAFKKSMPSLSDHDRISYEKLQKNLRQAKNHIIDEEQ